jgi:hypothetical protein
MDSDIEVDRAMRDEAQDGVVYICEEPDVDHALSHG